MIDRYEAAFPVGGFTDPNGNVTYPTCGLSKGEYFALELTKAWTLALVPNVTYPDSVALVKRMAVTFALEQADMLLEELGK